jgi:CubicO group peptidase (beta-lactamase class C family)
LDIHGFFDDRFESVRDAFAENFQKHGDVGASFSATIEGEFVVDLWGGHRDAQRSLPWEEDTIANAYSISKTMTFLCVLLLEERGELDFGAPVAHYWPEFGQNGKESIELRQVLSHSAGLPTFSRVLTAEEFYDWELCAADLAAQAPMWEPGTACGYHAFTQGNLIGEVVRRITGRTIGTFFREEFAAPLGADFHIGLDAAEFPRVAELIPVSESESPSVEMDPESIAAQVFGRVDLPENYAETAAWRRAELPAVNGHGNARSVVRAQTLLANDGRAFGKELLSADVWDRIAEVQIESVDLVMNLPIRFGLGYAYAGPPFEISRNPNALFWGGAGGSMLVLDRDARLCFSYVMNKMQTSMVGDQRSAGLSRALYASLD